MQVSKWGNSLAVRLPAAVVETLHLKEGDSIEIDVAGERTFAVRRVKTREEAVEDLRRRSVPLPEGFRFNREEAHERGK
jgi:antitoxin MazE